MATIKNVFQLYLKRRFLYNLIFLSLIYFAHCFWGPMMYIAFPILAVMVTLDSLENGISYIIFSIPFIFLNLFISVILFLVSVLIYFAKFYFIYFYKEKRKFSFTVALPLLALFIYCLMPTGSYGLNTIIRIMIFMAIFIVLHMITQKPEIFRGHFNIKLMCYSLVLSCLLSLTYYFSPYLKETLILVYLEEKLPRLMGLFTQPNVLAMFCEVVLSLLTFFIITKKAKIEDICLFVAISCIGILTFSKTYVIILTLLIATILIWCLTKDWLKTLQVFIPIALAILTICLIYPGILDKFANRFFSSTSECKTFGDFLNMITTGRFELWKVYLKYIGTHPLCLFFGRGLNAPMLGIESPHNGFIAIIYELGIVGTLLFILALVMIFREYFKSKPQKPHWAISIPIVVLTLIFLVEDLIFYLFY